MFEMLIDIGLFPVHKLNSLNIASCMPLYSSSPRIQTFIWQSPNSSEYKTLIQSWAVHSWWFLAKRRRETRWLVVNSHPQARTPDRKLTSAPHLRHVSCSPECTSCLCITMKQLSAWSLALGRSEPSCFSLKCSGSRYIKMSRLPLMQQFLLQLQS
jgi:hypothetical protein